MTNYNDGKWHGHNGGECPVHPESDVRAMTEMGRELNCKAKNIAWSQFNSGTDIIAFRVIKEYKEPREWKLVFDRNGEVLGQASVYPSSEILGHNIIHVREVIE